MRNFTDMDRLTNFSAQIGTRWEKCARQTWLRSPPRLDFGGRLEKPFTSFCETLRAGRVFPSTLLPSSLVMSVIKFELPTQPKPEIWQCRCSKCRDPATALVSHRQVPGRKSAKRNVILLSRWLR